MADFRNKCVKCGLDFKSVASFDEHRVFGEKENWQTRRCLTEQELRDIGMQPNKLGRWRRPLTDEQKARLYGETDDD